MNHCYPSYSQGGKKGFSLIELLVVMTVIGIILALSTPGLNQLMKTRSEGAAIASIQGTLEWARSRAVASNRWVWVGMKADDEGIEVFVLSSRDGSRDPKSSDEVVRLRSATRLQGVVLSQIPQFASAPRPSADQLIPEDGGWVIFSPDGEARFAQNPQLALPPTPGNSLLRWIEIGLKRQNSNKPGIVAQVAGLTGQVNVYEPQAQP